MPWVSLSFVQKSIPVALASVAILLFSAGCSSSQRYENLQNELTELQDCVEIANDRIDELNDQLLSAQNLAWSSYEDMGIALDDLYEVSRVDCY